MLNKIKLALAAKRKIDWMRTAIGEFESRLGVTYDSSWVLIEMRAHRFFDLGLSPERAGQFLADEFIQKRRSRNA